jgi:hypothetical protein
MKLWLLAAVLVVSTASVVPAQDVRYQPIALEDLLYALPMAVKENVAVQGRLVAWGEVSALDSENSREIMVDLRGLPEGVQATLNSLCAAPLSCSARVLGTVLHLRGEGLSELGILADAIELAEESSSDGPAISCTHDDNMASTRCDTGPSPVSVTSISINGGKCPVWNHRLIRGEIEPELRTSGDITSAGDYTPEEVLKLSAAVVERITREPIPPHDFFRFDAYRCGIQQIELETSAGPIRIKAHH